MYRNFSLRELCGLLAWIFLMIKIRGLVTLLPAEARDGGRGGGNLHPTGEGQALPGPTQYSTKRLKAHAPCPLSLVPLVHDDETNMSVYFIMRTLECLWNLQTPSSLSPAGRHTWSSLGLLPSILAESCGVHPWQETACPIKYNALKWKLPFIFPKCLFSTDDFEAEKPKAVFSEWLALFQKDFKWWF